MLLSLFTNAGTDSIAQSQVFPNSIFASSSQAQLHELLLKTTQENGLTNSVTGFKVGLTNVISIPANSELAIFTTDGSLTINEAKVKSSSDSYIDLVKQSQNSFSLSGVPAGVYTFDVIAQKGSARAAYEGILVLGEDPTNTQTRTIIEQQIVKESDDDDDDGNNGDGRDCDLSYPDVCIRPFPPDLDCPEVPHRNFKVLPPDPHDFDREGDGIGCESGTAIVSDGGLDGNDDNKTKSVCTPGVDCPVICTPGVDCPDDIPIEVTPPMDETPLPPADTILPPLEFNGEGEEGEGEGSDGSEESGGEGEDDEDEDEESGGTEDEADASESQDDDGGTTFG